jgi:hypothetical protein
MGTMSRRYDFSTLFFYEDTSLLMQPFCHPVLRLPTVVMFGCKLIKGYINQLCGETPTDLRTGVPAPTANFEVINVTLNETHRKATINAPYQSGHDARWRSG